PLDRLVWHPQQHAPRRLRRDHGPAQEVSRGAGPGEPRGRDQSPRRRFGDRERLLPLLQARPERGGERRQLVHRVAPTLGGGDCSADRGAVTPSHIRRSLASRRLRDTMSTVRAPVASTTTSRALPTRVRSIDWWASSANAQARQIASASQEARRGVRSTRASSDPNQSRARIPYSLRCASFRSTACTASTTAGGAGGAEPDTRAEASANTARVRATSSSPGASVT